ncbi:MAG: hypothetical protein EBS98_08760 [Chitinophagia bacterium]|nr:hypothetical protein [Chitinophagia bacterium]
MKTSYESDHLILHLSKNEYALTRVEVGDCSYKLKEYPYQLIFSSKLVQPTLTREELQGLADFINAYLKVN